MKFLITQTLLGSWEYIYKSDEGFDSFLKTLNRESTPPTKPMLDGNRFESMVNAVCKGAIIEPIHEWYNPIMTLAEDLRGAQQQVALSKDITVNGIDFVLYGRLDFLKAGIITDTKYSKTYEVGKYLDSPQHLMYFALTPGAYEFQYRICDGTYLYKETYRPEDTEPIEYTINNFMKFLDRYNLVSIFAEKWQSKY